MGAYRQIIFPYNKVKANSRVVLYGAGNIGQEIYQQNLRSKYCEIVAIADKVRGKVIDNLTAIDINDICTVEYDYIIVCTITGYQEEMCEKLFEMKIPQEKIVCVDDWIDPIEVKDVTMINAFRHIITEEQYRHISLESHPEMFQWYRNRNNWIRDTDRMTKLLLLGYEFSTPVFHVVDSDKHYLGTVDRKAINELNQIIDLSSDDINVRQMCELLGGHNIEISKASDISISVYELYKRFSKEGDLTEIPLVKDKILVDVIKKSDFDAFYSRQIITRKIPYVSARLKEYNGNIGLSRYAYDVNSQNGEDGIIEHIFKVIGLKSYYAVEFGGWDGIYLSNIRNLVLNNEMSALFIEGDPDRALEGKKNYEGNYKVRFVNEWVGFKNNKKLDVILEENNAPQNIDLLSIDIDGCDYQVWESLKKYTPRVVIIEYNPATSNEIVVINPNSESIRCGSSPLALVELGKRKGYELVAITMCNCIFVVKDEFEQLDILDNSLDRLRCGSIKENHQPVVTFRGDVLNDCFHMDKYEVMD